MALRLIEHFGSFGTVVTASSEHLTRVVGNRADVGAITKFAQAMSAALSSSVATVALDGALGPALLNHLRFPGAWLRHEQVRVLHLDSRGRLLRDEIAHEGTIDESAIYPREIVRRALEIGSSVLIVAHNHPSGNPAPSDADIALTQRLTRACEVFRLRLHDHIIVGDTGHTSFRALGLL